MLSKWNRKVDPDQFANMMKSIDYNSDRALREFSNFIAGPNVKPITIGHVGETIIQLYAGDHHLSAHELPDDAWGDVDENRAMASISVLGLWEDASQLRRGHQPDEGNASDGTSSSASATDTGSLEVFLQLGLLAYREPGSKDDFESSNYVLVTSVYDDSIWVLWRKYILDENTLDMDLASDVWQGDYAVFPGTPTVDMVRETIIYARIADNWADLQPSAGKALRFSHIRHASSTCDSRPEPIWYMR